VRLSKGDTDPSNGEIIWQRTPLPPSANLQFDFTHFTLSMNEIEKVSSSRFSHSFFESQ